MAARTALFGKEPFAELDFYIRRRIQLRNVAEQIGIDQLHGDVLRNLVEVFVRPAIARHARMRQIGFGIAQPGYQPIRVNLAADFGEFGADIATNQLCLAGARDRQRVAGGTEHLPETQFALRHQLWIPAPPGNDSGRNFIGREWFGFLNAEVAREGADLFLREPELRHARLFLGLVAVDGDVAVFIHNRPRLFQPFVNPFAADLCADAGKVRSEHRGAVDSLHFVATLAI